MQQRETGDLVVIGDVRAVLNYRRLANIYVVYRI